MRLTALELAAYAQLWVTREPDYGLAVRDGGRILVGPHASPDRIATIASRRLVQLELGRDDVPEDLVQAEVRKWGFRYVAPVRLVASADEASLQRRRRASTSV